LDERRVLTVSRVQAGVLGVRDVAISLPTVVGRNGGAVVLEPEMNAAERDDFEHSVSVLAAAATTLWCEH
jgi:L-lactate dehydrogenase